MDILYAGGVNNPMDSIEQISYLLFLRLLTERDEQLAALSKKYKRIFSGKWSRYAWGNFVTLTGDQLFDSTRSAIEDLHELPHLSETGRLLFRRATLKIYDRPTLRAVIQSVHEMDLTEHDGADIKGDMYEYLLSKISMSGTNGQFRTPRHIIDLIVEMVDPKPGRRICDPACGTAGFLISAFNHILKQNTSKADLKTGNVTGDKLKPAQWKFLEQQAFTGFDNNANMIKISILNLYLHKLEKANIDLHNPLTTTKGGTYPGPQYDCILANPPFSGKVQKESILSDLNHGLNTRATELLFLKWFIDHLADGGRAGVIVPEGIIFQSQNAYKKLRKILVDDYLWCVVSLPAGVFNPYSGVKTSILLMDKTLAKKTDKILFVKIENDGFDLGAQRRPIDKNDLPKAGDFIKNYKPAVMSGKDIEDTDFAHAVKKKRIAESGDWNLSGERYRTSKKLRPTTYKLLDLGDVAEVISGQSPEGKYYNETGEGMPFYQGKTEFAEMFISTPKKWTTQVTRTAQKGDILMSVRAPVGPVNIATQEICIGRGLAAIRANEMVFPLYLFYVLRALEDDIKGGGGAVFDSISRKQIQAIKIPLPPLDIQKAIVAEIDGYQKIIDGARQVVDNYKPTIKIDPDWPMVRLSEVTDLQNGYAFKSADYVDESNTLNLRMSNIRPNGNLDLEHNPKYLPDAYVETYSSYLLKDGDVVIAMTDMASDPKILGVPTIIKTDGRKLLLNQRVGKFEKVDTERINISFLCYILTSDKVKEYYKTLGSGGVQINIGKKDILSYLIPLPPLSVQQEIVAQVEAEQQIVNANKKLIEIYEQKIKDKIAEVWGCDTSQATVESKADEMADEQVRATTPYKDDAAVVCLLLSEMEKFQRPTTEFFIQKHIFVIKHHLHLPVNSVFKRKVAGPWSQELRWKAIEAAIKTNWLRCEKKRFVAGSAFEKGLSHAATVLGESAAKITKLVDDLKAFGNNGLERWTTVLKVVEDLKEKQQPITRANIQHEIDNWRDKRLKKIFAEESVDYTINKMIKYKWLPTASGQ